MILNVRVLLKWKAQIMPFTMTGKSPAVWPHRERGQCPGHAKAKKTYSREAPCQRAKYDQRAVQEEEHFGRTPEGAERKTQRPLRRLSHAVKCIRARHAHLVFAG